MLIRSSLFTLLSLTSLAVVAGEYSNSWILPAYAAGQKVDLNFDYSLEPPVLTFYPPMAGWCLGKTAKIGLPLVHDLGATKPSPVVFLANEELNDKVLAEYVRVCIDGYTEIPPEYDKRSVQVLNIVNTQTTEVQSLGHSVEKVSLKVQSLEQKINEMQGQIRALLDQNADTQKQILEVLRQNQMLQGKLAQAATRVANLESENSHLRSSLLSCADGRPCRQ